MKIKTTIEFEIECDAEIFVRAPMAGLSGRPASIALINLLAELDNRGVGAVITKVRAETQAQRQIPPDVSADVARRLDLRLRESEEEIGEWIWVEDRLPPMTVLGLTSAVCRVRFQNGNEGDAVYHEGDKEWKSPDGSIVFNTIAVREWRQKPGVNYSEPQERYEQVDRERRKKPPYDHPNANEFPY